MRHFVDRCKICVRAGNGGNGCSSFRREKFIPKGGPDGGNGGHGGDVILVALEDLYTVWQHCLSPHKVAESGKHGSGKKCRGANGADLIIYVPVGTQILCADEEQVLGDLQHSGQSLVIARGGRGGLGNTCFKSSINRAPRTCTKGTPGEEFWIWLQVKLLVDVGLIGLPNAGKSSLLNKLTRAKSKVADYPFTTLDPQLGVLQCPDHKILIADIPGLVTGSSRGKGLGKYFLRHVERCNLLLQVIDVTSKNIQNDFLTVREELRKYQRDLCERRHIIVLNKVDLVSKQILKTKLTQLQTICNKVPVIKVSALSSFNVDVLQQIILDNFLDITKNLPHKDDVTLPEKEVCDHDESWSPWHGNKTKN